MPSRQAAAAAALALAAFLVGAGAPSRAEPAPPAAPAAAAEIPAGIPVTLDGVPLPGEWDDAAAAAFGPQGPVLRLKHARGTLLLALAADRPWPRGGRLLLYAKAGADAGPGTGPGAVVVDYEPFEHHRPHAMVRVGTEAREHAVVFRSSGLLDAATVEAAVPLALLGVVDPEKPGAVARPLRWAAQWLLPGRQPSYASIPAGLDLGAVRQGLPPDLATTARWALAPAWKDAAGPGAFSKTDWTAWTAADRELAERGAKAHLLAIPLRDGPSEPPAGGDPALGKVDRPIDEDLLGGLRFVGAREPLTGSDLRVMAIGLWRTNRTAEALAVLEALRSSALGAEDGEALFLTGMVGYDAERFDVSAAAFDALAARLGPRVGGGFPGLAKRSRDDGALFAAEQAARREDAERDDQPLALLSTSKGDFVIRLLEDDAPESVKNFVHLAEVGTDVDGRPYFPGSRFHRVVANGLVQGGDPRSRNEGCAAGGGGGTTWWIPVEPTPRHSFFRGSVGYAWDDAHAKVRGQFFVTTAPRPVLRADGMPCFGTVISGMDVVDRLEACDVLRSVRIVRKRPGTVYEPKKRY